MKAREDPRSEYIFALIESPGKSAIQQGETHGLNNTVTGYRHQTYSKSGYKYMFLFGEAR